MQKILNKIDKAILEKYEVIKQSGKILCGIEETYRQVRFKNPELAVYIKKRMLEIAIEKGDYPESKNCIEKRKPTINQLRKENGLSEIPDGDVVLTKV